MEEYKRKNWTSNEIKLMTNLYKESILSKYDINVDRHIFSYTDYPFIINETLAIHVLKNIFNINHFPALNTSYNIKCYYRYKCFCLKDKRKIKVIDAKILIYLRRVHHMNLTINEKY